MGVLKVEVGAGWRKVGCGGRGIVDAVTLIIICTAFDGTQYDPPNLRYLRVNGVELYNTISGVFTGSDAPNGVFSLHITDPHSGGSIFWGLADPIAAVGVPPEGIPRRGGGGAAGGWAGPMTGTIISNQQWPAPDVIDPIPGRLRMQLPGGSWVREACDDDDLTDAHPLKIEVPVGSGTWVTVACMVPASDFALYDVALYDTAVYA